MALPRRVNPILVSSLLILGVGIIFHIISTVAPGWLSVSRGGASSRIGLFQYCNYYICSSLPEPVVKDELLSVRGLLISSIILEGLAGLFTIFHLVKLWANLANSICSLLCCVAASIMSVTAAIVYTLDYFTYSTFGEAYWIYDLDYSFGLCIAGSGLVAMGGGLIFLGGVQHRRALSALQNNPNGIALQPQVAYQTQPTTMMVGGQKFQPQPMYLVPQVPYVQQAGAGQFQIMNNVPQVPYVQQSVSDQFQMVSNGSQVQNAQQGVVGQSQPTDNAPPVQKQA